MNPICRYKRVDMGTTNTEPQEYLRNRLDEGTGR